jgi:hypothetical protein
MKILSIFRRALLSLGALLVFATPASATISIGQVGTASASLSNASLTTAAVNTSASGSGFVVMVAASTVSGATITYTMSDSFGNTYTQLPQLIFASGGATYAFDRWYIAPGATGYVGGGAAHTVTITNTVPSAASTWVALIEMPGAALTNAAFYGAAASHTYPFSHTPPYASTSLAVSAPSGGAVLLSGVIAQQPASGAGSESTGFTTEITNVIGVNGGAIGVRAVTTSATYTPSWTWTPTTSVVEAFSSIDSFFGASVPFAPILLDNAAHLGGSDQIGMGTGPGTGTGDTANVAFTKVKQWAADVNTMAAQLYPVRSLQTPTTGTTVTTAAGVTQLVLNPAGTLAALTVTMPPSPGDNQPFTLMTSQTLTSLTVSASGPTVNGAPTTLSANTSVKFRFMTSLNTWFRE